MCVCVLYVCVCVCVHVVTALLFIQNGLTCPTCKKVHGIRTGDMPDGTMTVRTTRRSLPGHEGYGMIEIVYNFSPGVHVSSIVAVSLWCTLS